MCAHHHHFFGEISAGKDSDRVVGHVFIHVEGRGDLDLELNLDAVFQQSDQAVVVLHSHSQRRNSCRKIDQALSSSPVHTDHAVVALAHLDGGDDPLVHKELRQRRPEFEHLLKSLSPLLAAGFRDLEFSALVKSSSS